MLARARAALPRRDEAAAGALVWAGILAASAAAWLVIAGRFETSRWQAILAVFALGGALAYPCALFAMRLVSARANASGRFAAAFLSLGLASVLGVAFVFSMQYRQYYAQWHEPFPSVPWFFQLAFTGAGSVYQFAVLGVRMCFPLAFAALFAFSLWQARRAR